MGFFDESLFRPNAIMIADQKKPQHQFGIDGRAARVEFYGSALELKTLHMFDRPGEKLTTLLLGDTYFMIETGGVASDETKTIGQNPTKFRFNVPDVLTTSAVLKNKGMDVNVLEHTWGTTAKFVDPEGNLCALRSDVGFSE